MTDCTSRISPTRAPGSSSKWLLPPLFAMFLALLLTGTGWAQTYHTIGTPSGTSNGTGYSYPTPYGAYYWGAKQQFLYPASELLAAGLSAGNISSVRFNVTSTNGVTYNGYTVRIGQTAATSLTAFQTGLTTVYGPQAVVPVVGLNTYTFSSPFVWDGTSNVVMEICFANTSYTANSVVEWTTSAAYNASWVYIQDSGFSCANTTSNYVDNLGRKPVTQFGFVAGSACTGTPAPGNTTGPASACSGATINLGLQNPTSGSGVTYQWQSSPDGTTWTNVGTSTSNYSTTQTAATYYQAIVTCTEAGGGSATSAPILVNMGSACLCSSYCATSNQGDGACITGVSINTLSSTTGACVPLPGYTLKTNTTTLTQGTTYPLTISVDANIYGGGIVSVWFDWNGDGNFTASEWYQPYTAGVNGTINVAVPVDAALGQIRMRVRSRGTGNINGATDACTGMGSGTTEDFCITIAAAAPCAGTPAPGNTVANVLNACTNTQINLNLQNATPGSGITYQWQSSPDGVTWNNVGTSSPSYSTTQSATTWYQAIVTCTEAGGGSATSTPLQVTQNSFLDCYCSSNATNSFDGAIANVTFGGLNNTSTCAVAAPGPGTIINQYSNYKTLPPTSVMQGQSIPFSALASTCNGNYGVRVAFFVDWNQNGLLTDPGEMLYISSYATTPYTASSNVIVPFTAVPGNTLLRVIQVETSADILPCGTYAYGETEDYLINVLEAAPCVGTPDPGNTIVSNPNSCSGATVNLTLENETPGTGVTFQWQVSTDGPTGPWTDFGPNQPFTTATPSVESWYQAVVTCTEVGGGSETSIPVQVTMAPFYDCYCTTALHQFTYPCISNVSLGNTLNNPSSTSCTSTYTNYAGGGPSTTGIFERGVGYTLTTNTNDFATVSVWIDYDQSGTFDASEWVQTQTTGTMGTTAITIPLTAELGITGMRVRTNYTWSQPNGAGDACTPFTYGETEDYQITIAVEPPCIAPPNITTQAITLTSVTIGWDDILVDGYNWELRTSGAPGTAGAVASGNTTGTSFSVTGLNPGTTYYAYVQSDCGVDGLSSWSAQHTFYTGYCGGSNPGPTSTADTDIVSVSLIGEDSAINNASGCPATLGVANYLSQSATLIPGNAYALTVDFGSCGGAYPSTGEAWIDWNQNMVFDPAESLGAFQETASSTLLGLRVFNFVVPANAVIGNTVLRVMHVEGGGVPPLNPCLAFTWGAIEDYGINVCAPPVASASVTDDCANEQFSIDVDGGAANYTIYYTVDGGAQQSAAYSGSILTLGPFATTALVDVEVSAGPGCTLPLGGFASNCPIVVDCSASQALLMNHCYGNNDGRTFTFVSSDPLNTLVFKFLQPSPVDVGDGVTFYDGELGTGTQISLPPAGGDLSSLGTINSSGNTLSFNIQSDATGSCVDGGVNGNWNFQVRCAGCIEPSADPVVTTDCSTFSFNLQIDLWDLGFSDITGLPANSASIQYTVNGVVNVIEDITEDVYDLGNFSYNDVVHVVILHEDDGSCNLVMGNFTHSAPCPPVNDQCAAALPLSVNPPSGCPGNAVSGTTQYADMSGTMPSCTTTGTIADVWYTFNTGTSLSPMTITLTPGTANNVGYQVFTACGTPWGGTGACTASANGTATITGLAQNTNYWLRIFTRTNLGSAGTFNVCLSANNAATLCDSAINIPSAPVTNQAVVCGTMNGLNATTVTTSCGGGSTTYTGGLEAIYTFTPTVTGSYIISYSGQSWTSINVHANACPSAGGTCVGAIANSATLKTLTVPMTAGTTYYIWFDTWPSPPSACPGTFSLMMETCPSATGVTATSVTYNSASINWTGTPGNYIIEYGPSATFITPGTGALPGTGGTVVTTSTWPYTLTPLLSSTQYRVFVRRDCSGTGDGYSVNSPQVFFTTGAAPPTPPVCNALWYDSGGPSGTYGNNENWTFTVCPDVPGDVASINFTSFNTEASWDRLYIYDGPTTASPMFSSGNGVGFGTSPYGAGGWWGTTIPGPFTATVGNGGCLTFAFWSDNSVLFPGWEAFVTCAAAPTCPPATGVSITELTSTSATINWNGDPGTYLIEYGPSSTFSTPGVDGLPGTGGTVVSTSVWPYEIMGLTADTEYRVFVRRDCSGDGDGYSTNTNGLLFNTGGCTNTFAYGTVAAPASGASATIFCIYATQYGTFTNASAGQEYTVVSAVAGDFLTVRTGSYNGASVAMGTSPLTFTAPASENLYVHVNTNASCGTQSSCRDLTMSSPVIDCQNEFMFESNPAPALGDSQTNIGVFAGEYTVFTAAVAGQYYTVSSSVLTDAITVRSGTYNGVLVASGIGSVGFTAPASADLFVHVNTDASCGTENVGRDITMEATAPECTNTTPYGTQTAPAPGGSATIFCQYASEYGTWNSAVSGQQYTVSSTVGTDFFTVRSGTSAGPVVSSGTGPLTFTSTVSGTLYIHVNLNADCAIENLCRDITLTASLTPPSDCLNPFSFGSSPAPAPGNSATNLGVYAGEYTIFTAATAGQLYSVSSSTGTDYLTVRISTYDGTVEVAGTSPVTFTASASADLFVHVNTDVNCGDDANGRDITIEALEPECTNSIAYGNNPAPAPGDSWTVGCSFSTEYSTWTAVVSGQEYTVSSDTPTDFLTVRSGTSNGPVVIAGTTPLTFTTTSTDNLYVHVNTDANCGTDSNCHDITMSATPPDLVSVNSSVFLDGPFNTGTSLMNDNLRVQGLIPTAQPYSGAPWNYAGTETVDPAIFAVTGNDAIVDWVLLELRDENAPATIVARRAALVQRDGSIVDVDGVSPVEFAAIASGNYYLAVRHRNHLGAMTAATYPLSYIPTDIDLTTAAVATYGTNARRDHGGVMALWGGNANPNTVVNYNGLNNDRQAIVNLLGPTTILTPQSGYYTEDVTMNGLVNYNGLNNDRQYLVGVLGAATILTPRVQQLP